MSPVREFIHDSRAVGIVLIIATVISIFISNTGWQSSYTSFWNKELISSDSGIHLPHTILHIINDALMAVFFLLVGLEIKRELLVGELASIKKSLLPVIAAIGGMVVPAYIYFLWCGKTPYSGGWGVPMATDIAFSLGILSLLGKRVPLSFRIFLTALAIIDDLGAIIAIAMFYSGDLNVASLLMALAIFTSLLFMNMRKVRYYSLYFILGIAMWYFIFNSGIHATLAGVLLAFTLPLHKIEALEHVLHDPVNFVILPLFALANTAIILPADFLSVFTSPINYGIFTGLFLGKPIGIVMFSFIAVRTGLATLPQRMRWKHLLGLGFIAGIGFTMSIFIATLAFASAEAQTIAKMAIILASLFAGIAGYVYLRAASKNMGIIKASQ